MSRYDHPLTGAREDREETYTHPGADVIVNVSPDGKRVDLTVIDQQGEEQEYELGGVQLNGTPIRADEALNLYGVDAVIEWQSGGLGLYPGVNLLVSPHTGQGGD